MSDVKTRDMHISVRAKNALINAGIEDTSHLLTWSARALLRIKNVGRVMLEEIEVDLDTRGMTLRIEDSMPPLKPGYLQRKVAAAVSAEREECAKIADDVATNPGPLACEAIAIRIRARGQS